MRSIFLVPLFGLAVPLSSAAQAACSAGALPQAARTVAAVRHQLHGQAVGELDPKVPPAVAAQLGQLKAALVQATEAAFSCADSSAEPDTLEKTLATALHANLANATDTVIVTREKKDLGAYGADLAVQVFQLFGSPKFYEVDLRYGVECGDDNLLLVFESDKSGGPGAWHERLRWSAPSYTTVGDAFGNFVLLTPLPGEQEHRNWRFVVAHGHPSCRAGESNKPTPSRFDLDLLKPTDDPAQPTVLWHTEHDYIHSDLVPRLATTEDTVEFRVSAPGAGPKAAPTTTVYRYEVSVDNQVKELAAAPNTAPTPDTAPASTSSPQ